MRKTNHQIAMFLIFQQIRDTLSLRNRIFKLYIPITFGSNQSFQLRSQTKNSNLYAVTLNDSVFFNQSFEHSARHVIICTYYRIIRHFKQPCHIIQPEIELMIADGSCIIAHFVHQLYFHFPFKHIIIRSTLRKIS